MTSSQRWAPSDRPTVAGSQLRVFRLRGLQVRVSRPGPPRSVRQLGTGARFGHRVRRRGGGSAPPPDLAGFPTAKNEAPRFRCRTIVTLGQPIVASPLWSVPSGQAFLATGPAPRAADFPGVARGEGGARCGKDVVVSVSSTNLPGGCRCSRRLMPGLSRPRLSRPRLSIFRQLRTRISQADRSMLSRRTPSRPRRAASRERVPMSSRRHANRAPYWERPRIGGGR